MCTIKHHLLLFDAQLCEDQNLFTMISEKLIGSLLLANHLKKPKNLLSVTVGTIVFDEGGIAGIEVRPVLSPMIDATTNLNDIAASITKMATQGNKNLGKVEPEDSPVTIDWNELNTFLTPYVQFPPREEYLSDSWQN